MSLEARAQESAKSHYAWLLVSSLGKLESFENRDWLKKLLRSVQTLAQRIKHDLPYELEILCYRYDPELLPRDKGTGRLRTNNSSEGVESRFLFSNTNSTLYWIVLYVLL
jgi:hypothetical protein